MRTRVVYLDTGNRKLLWRQALEQALGLSKPQPRPLRWWEAALAFLDRVWL